MFDSGEFSIDNRRIAFTVARSKRRRRSVAFTMEEPGKLRILVPMRASLFSIHSILQRQGGWIRRRLAELERAPPAPSFHEGTTVMYLGHACRLSITRDADLPQGCRLLPHRLIVNLHTENMAKIDLEHEVRLEILLWLKKRAKAKFQKRMDLWANRLGVRYTRLVVANAEKRWGSCNAQNVIRLNWRLIMAPLPLLDYVVVHELCHVRNKNHGPGFWGQVASVLPDWKAKRRHLRFIGSRFVL